MEGTLLQIENLQNAFSRYFLCLGALPLLYPAAPPSVFAFGKYTAPAVALEREYVVEFLGGYGLGIFLDEKQGERPDYRKNYGIPKILLGYPDFFVSMNLKRANCL